MNSSSISTFLAFFAVILAVVHAAPLSRRDINIPRSALFSESTYRFVTISETVHANGDAGNVESQFFVTYLGGNQLRLQSAKVETCFLQFVNGEFKGGVPLVGEDNDVFEMVNLEYNMIALRVVNTAGSGASETPEVANTEEVQAEEVANTEESPVSECYLGFDSFGRPGCYDSTDSIATKYLMIPLSQGYY